MSKQDKVQVAKDANEARKLIAEALAEALGDGLAAAIGEARATALIEHAARGLWHCARDAHAGHRDAGLRAATALAYAMARRKRIPAVPKWAAIRAFIGRDADALALLAQEEKRAAAADIEV